MPDLALDDDRATGAWFAPLLSTLLTLPACLLAYAVGGLSAMACDSCAAPEADRFESSFGNAALRGRLEHLLEVARLRNVELQVMTMDREEHAGLAGGIEVLKFEDGSAVGRSPVMAHGRPVHEPKHLRILELGYGIVRAQALTPRESPAFVERLLGET
jgi:hypothetical protein